VIFLSYRRRFFADQRSDDGRGWNDERIDISVCDCQMELLDELFACFEGL
jgi:hypothetical protein